MTEASQHTVPSTADLAFPSEQAARCPFPFYETLRREAPVYRDPSGSGYFVSRRRDIMTVLQHPELFSNESYRSDPRMIDDPRELLGLEAPELPGSPLCTAFNMSVSDPPEHTVKRRSAAGLVARARLDASEPVIRQLADELIDAFIADGEVEFRQQFAAPLALLTICELAGFPRSDRDTFLSWVLSSQHGRLLMDDAAIAALARDSRAQMQYCHDLILERHRNPREDFLSDFIAASIERDGELNMPYLISELRLILTAGNETTQRLITNTMLLLLRNPGTLERLRDDRQLVPAALEESLRIEAPTQWVSRIALQDTEIDGVAIAAGSLVFLLYGSANRDETWESPDSFDLDRPDVQKYHLGFGGGIHRCLGAPVARLEARVALNAVLDRLTDIRLSDPTAPELENIDNLQKRVPQALRLSFRPV